MLIRLSGPRLLAILLLSALFGWWLTQNDATQLAELRGLSHEALMDKLAKQYDGNYATNMLGGFFVVLLIYGGVEFLTRLLERAATQLGLRRPTSPGDAASTSPAPFA